MIALDPDHTTDPDYPVEFSVHGGRGPDEPVWCEWEWVYPDDDPYQEPYMDYFPPYGQTVSQLRAREGMSSDAMSVSYTGVSEAEVDAYDPIWDSPGTSPEEDDECPVDDDDT